ncbi:competence protein ComEC [Kribbella amoyensis]|uniref:Competence protein ComEC n=1 Tax=Kribbella amoyensis TaxID=996641 RepID=A0A561BVG0_9ACTN|nr:ComEC/Rec2 family competence protein [Kribbella amoyensis]TWD82870.1 competence protein ComEC [Kribbella amoyensis]
MSASDPAVDATASAADPVVPEQNLDARLLLPAAFGWLAAVVLTARSARFGLAAAIVLTALAGALALLLWLRKRLVHRRQLLITCLGILTVTAGMSGAAALQVLELTSGPVPDLAAKNATAKVRLQLAGDPAVRSTPGSRRPPYVVVKATLEQVTARGESTKVRTPVLVIGSEQWRHVRFGQSVEATGRLGPVDSGSDVAAILSARSAPKPLDDPAWWLRAAERVRAGLRESVADQPPNVRGLVPALVMGDESALPAELIEDFRTTGLTHLSAVSGTNLTLLLAFVLPLARLLGVRARGLTVVGLAMVVVFVVLARPQPSVLRAAAMGLVALAAMTGSGGRRRAVRSLSVAVIALLLLDTSLARSAGFALSVLATAGIVLLGPAWRDALARWLPVRLAEAVSCPLAAQLACTPIVAWLSGEVSLVAVAANLLAGPAVGPATILGFGAAGIALLSADLARWAGWLAAWPARWIILIAERGADLPGATNPWPATVVGVAILTALCLALCFGLHRILARPIAMLLAVVLLVVAVLRPTGRLGWPPGDWVMVACDVGQGDGLVLRVAPGSAVVVDTGPDPTPMDRCLQELGIRHVPVLILTHFHADHAGGLAGVLHNRKVDEIEVTPYASPPAEHRRVQALAAAHRIPVRAVTYQERRTVGALTWTTLWPARVPALPGTSTAPSTDEGSPENNASITLLAEAAGLRLLLTGDLEPESQRAILADHPDLRADVVKVPHHGSAYQSDQFLQATRARLALISAGLDNDYGHPAPRTLDLLTRLGTTIRRTDQSGSIAVTNPGNRLSTTTSGPSP